ncbi:MAG: ATP-binding protein [Ignavibacteriaceae bacterium]|jgi:predicted AAA+ superfamily ATPase|nr:ATP-binding protein [Ignavibacteriaceae bacterium]
MIKREIQDSIESRLFKGKLIVIYGARQVGKTTLIKEIGKKFSDQGIYLNCDEPDIRELLTDATSTKLKNIVGKKTLVLIDEAQRVKNIGVTLKLFVDELKNVQVIATGSSSFELSNEINEPLTGRKFEYTLYPFSMRELGSEFGWLETNRLLEERILYGMYPDVVLNPNDKKDLLKDLTKSYLFKDVLSYQGIRKPEVLDKLLIALAAQIGSEVSYNELAGTVGIDKDTVTKYLDILEKAFVIFRLHPFSRNIRTEITKLRKVYFYDTGIRNALISNFNTLASRNDKGALWENFLISEKLKMNSYLNIDAKAFFWRTSQQQEIDYIEEKENSLYVYEFSYKTNKKKKIPLTFLNAYPTKHSEITTNDNYREFLSIK